MESVEAGGRTVEEAIDKALRALGAARSEVEIEVLSEARQGILGLGSGEARVLARRRPESGEGAGQAVVLAQEVAERLLALMGLSAKVEVSQAKEEADARAPLAVDIHGPDLGVLIGRGGGTLTAFQYLLSVMLGRRLRRKIALTVDVENYRARRADYLRSLALRLADRAVETRAPVTLEAMPAHERRVIHLALQDHPYVTTESAGDGEDRRVVISSRAQAPAPSELEEPSC